MEKLLTGVRVLEVAAFSPVKFGTTILADLGADVIQIDKPHSAQRVDARGSELPLLTSPEHPRWLWHSRNKRSVVLDLRQAAGQQIFYDLLATSDAVVEGFAAGAAEHLGVDYGSVRARKPDIVYARVSGFAEPGPDARLGGHEQNYQAMSGLTAASGGPDREPAVTPLPVSDSVASLYMAIAVLAALQQRQATGLGAHLSISIQDAVLSLFGYNAQYYWRAGVGEPRTVREFGGHPGTGVYATADARHVVVSAVEPWAWERLCAVLSAGDLAGAYEATGADADAVRARLGAAFAAKTRDEWQRINSEHNVGISPVLDYAELLGDRHMRERGMVNTVPHPTLGNIEQLATPIAVDGHIPASYWMAWPGGHTEAVLAELGYSGERRAQLRDEGVVDMPVVEMPGSDGTA
jgi:crotonobetainyl-CoA:carnitine CoA-transferase CaiB-like acyl-CoA transferase